jgi:anti-anti-sigma factor
MTPGDNAPHPIARFEQSAAGAQRLCLYGNLDWRASALLKTLAQGWLHEASNLNLEVSFEAVESLSSASVQVLVSLAKSVRAGGGKFYATGIAEAIQDDLQTVGFEMSQEKSECHDRGES